ncbi:hypothetical protein GE061_001679 [Apolygus lucorum]|uniref:Uncharacterized protein n=1 Tax=Apolygus lucorum TaxID=248454 RepID=A0A8S9YG39_APOLU|nr:hypothetical protein GE061_001679 [Apolygus lucorum]
MMKYCASWLLLCCVVAIAHASHGTGSKVSSLLAGCECKNPVEVENFIIHVFIKKLAKISSHEKQVLLPKIFQLLWALRGVKDSTAKGMKDQMMGMVMDIVKKHSKGGHHFSKEGMLQNFSKLDAMSRLISSRSSSGEWNINGLVDWHSDWFGGWNKTEGSEKVSKWDKFSEWALNSAKSGWNWTHHGNSDLDKKKQMLRDTIKKWKMNSLGKLKSNSKDSSKQDSAKEESSEEESSEKESSKEDSYEEGSSEDNSSKKVTSEEDSNVKSDSKDSWIHKLLIKYHKNLTWSWNSTQNASSTTTEPSQRTEIYTVIVPVTGST